MNTSQCFIKFLSLLVLLTTWSIASLAQSPSASPTPTDQRGIGVQSSGPTSSTQAAQQAKEAKPELVLQTGYNDLLGATRLAFSPDGKLLATGTYRSSAIKLWETATGRKLRELTTGTGSSMMGAGVVAFSRDSQFVAAAGADNTVKVWEVATGREVQTLAGTQGSLMASVGIFFMAFTPDNRLVTASDAIRVWDISSGRELSKIDASSELMAGFTGTDSGLTLTPDGTQLTVTGSDSEIRFLELSSGREVRRVKIADERMNSIQLAFSPEGHLLAAGIDDKKRFKFFDLTSKASKELSTTINEFAPVKFSPDGRFVALADAYTAKIWEVATMRELPTLKIPNSGAFGSQAFAYVAFSNDGQKIATGGYDTETIIWETATGKQLSKMTGRTNMAYHVRFSADGTQLSAGGRTRWDLRTGRGLRTTPASLSKTFPIPSPDGTLLAIQKLNSPVVSILEATTGRELKVLSPTGAPESVQRLRFSDDGSLLVVNYMQDPARNSGSIMQRGVIKVWDVKTGTEIRTITPDEVPSVTGLSKDGKILATATSMGAVSLWDIQTGNKLTDLTSSPMKSIGNVMQFPQGGGGGRRPTMPMPNMADIANIMTTMIGTMAAGTMGRKVTDTTFSPDGRLIALSGVETKANIDIAAMMNGAMNPNQKPKKGSKQSQDPNDIMKDLKVDAVGQVQFMDVATGQEVASVKGHGKAVTLVAFSRDNKFFATAASDNTIKIWDATNRRELTTLRGHTANIESIDFSPDNQLIASAAEDGATFLWDANTGEHLLTLISLDDGGEWMVVTPQGLFDGTPATWNQILWRYNQETYNVAPIEWFFNEFYYPGLLGDIFAGKRPKVSTDISKKDRRQPIVKLAIPGDVPASDITSRTVKLKIDIADAPADKNNPQSSGARDVRLFRNGSLVKVWHGDVLNGQPNVTLEQEVTVKAGENQFVAYAFNKDNVKSKDAPLAITGAPSLKRKGVAYVIAVGLNEYENKDYNLKYAVADAQSFGDEIRAKQNQIGEYERVEVVSLINENATKANILSALKRLSGQSTQPSLKAGPLDNLKKVEPEDSVIIFYAGHGTAQQARFFLIPHDLGYKGERTELDREGLKAILAHSISDLELEDAVEGIDAGHLLLIIDACNSGQALEAEEKRRGPMNSKGLAQLAYEKGMYILTAAQSFQAALEAAQLGHGLLTYALVEEGLKTSVADYEPKDGLLIAREWLDFATERVPQMQVQKMNEGRGVGLAFTEGEKSIPEPNKRSVQRPRVFYRREIESNPLVIAKP